MCKRIFSLFLCLTLVLATMGSIATPVHASAATQKYIYDADVLPNGNIAVVYRSEGKIFYGELTPGTHEWNKTELGGGKEAALDVDLSGIVHIAYIDANDDLVYTNNGSGLFAVQENAYSNDIDGTGSLYKPDISTDFGGNVHIMFFDSHGGNRPGESYYRIPDIMYLTNTSGTFVKTVAFYGDGDYEANWYGYKTTPKSFKSTVAGNEYILGTYYTYSDKSGRWYNDNYFNVRNSTGNISNDYRRSYTIYDMDTDGANYYMLSAIDSGLSAYINNAPIPGSGQGLVGGTAADMFVTRAGEVYYSTLSDTNLFVWQNGAVKSTPLNTTTPINPSHKTIATVVTGPMQYTFYTDAVGTMWAEYITIHPGEPLGHFMIPDKQEVTISGLSISDSAYDGNAVSLSGTATAVDEDGNTVTPSYDSPVWKDASGTTLPGAPSDVGSYSVSVSVSDTDSKYYGSWSSNFNITKRTLNITGMTAETKAYDGNTDVVLSGGELDGILDGDDVSAVMPTSGTLDTKNAGTGKSVTLPSISLSGSDASKYTVGSAIGLTATVTPIEMTVTAISAKNKSYDGSDDADITYSTFDGYLPGETFIKGTDYTFTGSFDSADVGTGKVVTGTVSLADSVAAGNYYITDGSVTGTADITKSSALNVTSTHNLDNVKDVVYEYTYDLTQIELSKSDTGTVTYSLGRLTDASLFDTVPSIDADGTTLRYTSAAVNAGASKQFITVTTDRYEDVTAELNFALVDKYVAEISGVRVSNRTYDGTAIAATGTPVAKEDGSTVSVTGYDFEWFVSGSRSPLAGPPSDAGQYTLRVSIEDAEPMYQGFVSIDFEIYQKALSVSGLSAQNRTYDGTASVNVSGGSLNGVVSGDDVSGNFPLSGMLKDNNNAGMNKAVTIAPVTLGGSDKANYTVNSPSELTVSISRAPLSVSALTAEDKVYDGTAAAVIDSVTFSGLVGSESLTAGLDYIAVGHFAGVDAASDITVTGNIYMNSTTAANNYDFDGNSKETTADITKASGLAASSVPGTTMVRDVVYSYTYDLTSIDLNKDDTGTVTYSLATLSDSTIFTDVPALEADGMTLAYNSAAVNSGTASQTVTISSTNYQDINVQIDFTLADKAPVTIVGMRVDDKTYDGTAAAFTGSPVAKDSSNSPVFIETGYTATWYQRDLSGAKTVLPDAPTDAGLYTLVYAVQDSEPLYTGSVNIDFEISPKILTITGMSANDRTYDGTASVDITAGSLNGVVAGDDVTGNFPATGTLGHANAGMHTSVTIAPVTLSGADKGNYKLQQTTVGNVSIYPKALTINTVSVENKVYDQTNVAVIDSVSFDGLIAGDTLVMGTDFIYTAAFSDKNAGNGKTVTANISLSLSPAGRNYTLSDGSAQTTATIHKATGLTATSVPDATMFKNALKEYTYDLSQITLSKSDAGTLSYADGIVTGRDLFSLVPALRPDGTSLVYASASVSSGTASKVVVIRSVNYEDLAVTIDFKLVDKLDVSLYTLPIADKEYEGKPAALASEVVAKDNSGSEVDISQGYEVTWHERNVKASLQGAPRDAGDYTVVIRVKDTEPMYKGSLSLDFSITKKELNVTGITPDAKTFDGTTDLTVSGGELNGVIAGDDVTGTFPTTGTLADSLAGTGITFTVPPVTISGADSSNYSVNQPTAMTSDVAKAELTVSGADVSDKGYDGTVTASVEKVTLLGQVNGYSLDTDDYIMSGDFLTADAGTDKDVNVTVTLIDNADTANYFIDPDKVPYLKEDAADVTAVTPLTVTDTPEQKVYRKEQRTYTYDLTDIVLDKNDPGEITYLLGTVTDTQDTFEEPPVINGTELTVKMNSRSSSDATIEILVQAQNYLEGSAILALEFISRPAPSTPSTPSSSPSSSAPSEEVIEEEAIPEVAPAFVDIVGHWSVTHVTSLFEQGLLRGYEDNTFRPDNDITRAEFITLVVRALELEEGKETPFTDITSHWAKDAIQSAYAVNIIRGKTETTFCPDEKITREEMAKIICKAFDIPVIDIVKRFDDEEDFAPWAVDYIYALSDAAIIEGYEDNTFHAGDLATRADAAKFINRAIEWFIASKEDE